MFGIAVISVDCLLIIKSFRNLSKRCYFYKLSLYYQKVCFTTFRSQQSCEILPIDLWKQNNCFGSESVFAITEFFTPNQTF